MSSPKIICKSGYITSARHVLNTLDYAGNKIAAQSVLFRDGSVWEVDEGTRITLSKAQQEEVTGIRLTYKDGGSKVITYEAYEKLTREKHSVITVEELELVEDEELLVNEDGKTYHRTQDLNFFSYLNYIEGRPGVEKSDGHGLFGLTGDIPIADAQNMAMEYPQSRKWSHIISLETQGAKRTGFDRREMWAALIRSKAPGIAKAYNISLENLVIDCAFHGNTDNPHVHLLFYSNDAREGFVKGGKKGMQKASETLKSALYNTIFREDAEPLKETKTHLRDEMARQLRQHLKCVQAKDYVHTSIAQQLRKLSQRLEGLPGKKVYGYLPPEVKDQVNKILREMIANDPDMQGLYLAYLEAQQNFIAQYVSNPEKIRWSIQAFEQRFFEPGKGDLKLYHNAIIKAALGLRQPAQGKAAPSPKQRATKEKISDPTTPGTQSSTAATNIPEPTAVASRQTILSTAQVRGIVNGLMAGAATSLYNQTRAAWQNTKGGDKKQGTKRAKRKLRHKRQGIAQEPEQSVQY